MIKELRSDKGWSQERLAELSGLSLRTIQRLESSNRVSAESLLALADAFEVEVEALEKDLTLDKSSPAWKKRPLWLRFLFLGSSRIQMDKQQHKYAEAIAATAGLLLVGMGTFEAAGNSVPANDGVTLLICGSALIFGAYLMALVTRTGDAWSVWPWLDTNLESAAKHAGPKKRQGAR
jgi:transcriptional regulator with XRE-family HTH domain